jgi:hypothetical protein
MTDRSVIYSDDEEEQDMSPVRQTRRRRIAISADLPPS